jgi:hypothetical protein
MNEGENPRRADLENRQEKKSDVPPSVLISTAVRVASTRRNSKPLRPGEEKSGRKIGFEKAF